MRIVFVGPFGLKPKSTVRSRAVPLARALRARGHETTVLVPPLGNREAAGTTELVGGVPVVNVRLPRSATVGYGTATAELIRRALRLRPDAVHCFKPKGFPALVLFGLRLLRTVGAHRSRLVQDTDDWEGDGGWNDREGYAALQRRVFAWQERWALQNADAITVASRELERIVRALAAPSDRVLYLPNGVDAAPPVGDRARGRRSIGVGGEPLVLLYTRFFEFDLARVVGVWEEVRRRRPDARLLVVGRGLFGEEKPFAALLTGRGLGESAILAGWVEGEHLADLLAAADAAIYPMDDTVINRTKCPVKLVDLLAAGVPVAGEAIGQVGEYIRPDETGILVPSGDRSSLADAVLDLLDDAARRERLGRAARKRMASEFQWDRFVPALERLYAGDTGPVD
ncbi:MAG: glycosyltransferase family 4 protein [Chloroflexi bacterium]|nr:glycosyltransferase family 4 protein [Chloroflexota bacterium]